MSMSETLSSPGKAIPWFQIFKYSVYTLLSANIFFFFQEEHASALHMYTNGFGLAKIIEVYPATIDTVSWVVLLFVFEMETRIISDEKLHGSVKGGLTALKLVCYAFISYALYGYVSTYLQLLGFEPSALTNLCGSHTQPLSFMTTLDEFEVVNASNCQTLTSATTFFELPNTAVVADPDTYSLAKNLAMIDVINAAAWVLLVCILSIDVWWQMKAALTDRMIKISTVFKGIIYLVLFACAVYWGIDGKFIDFWDAFLWILAFFFIEMNLFEWHEEVEERMHPVDAG